MCFLFLFLYLCLSVQIIFSQEYIYPVATVEDGKTILLIHQKTPMHIELLLWDPVTKEVEQGLWSFFNPAGLQLLPDLSGFSFVDNGRLYVKYFNKRAPKAIDFSEPLWNINLVHWVKTDCCYLSAQCSDFFSIYSVNVDGDVNSLVSRNKKDCLYPQKMGDFIFYIERSKIATDEVTTNNYRIMKTDFYSSKQNRGTPEMIIEYNENPIIFLQMLSQTEGFLIEHPKTINREDTFILFHYQKIKYENDIWSREKIFSFAIPSSLLLHGSTEQLYESLLPILPRMVEGIIYFVDCSHNKKNRLELFSYELSTNKRKLMCASQKQNDHFFVPFFSGDKLFVGGTVNNISTRLWVDEKRGACVLDVHGGQGGRVSSRPSLSTRY